MVCTVISIYNRTTVQPYKHRNTRKTRVKEGKHTHHPEPQIRTRLALFWPHENEVGPWILLLIDLAMPFPTPWLHLDLCQKQGCSFGTLPSSYEEFRETLFAGGQDAPTTLLAGQRK